MNMDLKTGLPGVHTDLTVYLYRYKVGTIYVIIYLYNM